MVNRSRNIPQEASAPFACTDGGSASEPIRDEKHVNPPPSPLVLSPPHNEGSARPPRLPSPPVRRPQQRDPTAAQALFPSTAVVSTLSVEGSPAGAPSTREVSAQG